MKIKRILSFVLVILVGLSFIYANGTGRYIVILKQPKVLLDTEANESDIIRNSVKNNGKSVIDSIKKFNSSVVESTDGILDAGQPPVKYKELWLTNSISVQGSSKIVEVLKKDKNVEKVIPDFEVCLEEMANGKDESFSGGNSERKIYNWGVKYIKAPDAWEQFGTRGRGALVGLLDTGINANNMVFRDEFGNSKLIKYKDFAKPNATPSDSYGHGSHTSGIVVGGRYKGQYIGVAPDAKIIFGKVFGVSGKTFFSVVVSGLQWMSDPDGNPATKDYPCAINCSFRVPTPGNMNQQQELQEFNKIAKNLMSIGIIPVKSAGNSGQSGSDTITMPGYSPYFLTVGAIDSTGKRAYFSSIGKSGVKKPNVMAPGKDIYSASNSDNGLVVKKSGTSMAAPCTCGLIALIKSANPKLTAKQIVNIIEKTATDIGSPGFDTKTGNGVINAYKAVEMAKKMRSSESGLNQVINNNKWIDIDKMNRFYYDYDSRKEEIKNNDQKLNNLMKKFNLNYDK